MSDTNKTATSSDVEIVNNSNEATAKPKHGSSKPAKQADNKPAEQTTELVGTPTNEPAVPVVESVKVDAIAAGNKKAFDSIQGIALTALNALFTTMFLAFNDRMQALKDLLGDAFDESEFWADDDIAKSVINGATLEHQGYDASGKPKMVKNQLNAKMAGLIAPFIVGLGVRTVEQFNALLATRKHNSLNTLANEAYAYGKSLSIIPALAKVGLLPNTERKTAYSFVRNEFKNEVPANMALKHMIELAKANGDGSKIKENRISLDDVKTVQEAIKKYNTQLKESKTDKAIAEPVKLSWETIFKPIATTTAQNPAVQPSVQPSVQPNALQAVA